MRKLAPNYKGKPENFNPDPKTRVGKTKTNKRNGPKSPELAPPTHLDANKNPTPQRNESIISEAIFGVDVSVVAIAPLEEFNVNLSKIIDITLTTYQSMVPDVLQIERKFTKEELAYYSTAMLWIRLIDIKSKQRRFALTSTEKEILKASKDVAWTVPQPIYAYLMQMGNVIDRMGKETFLAIPPLPVTVNQNLGGYHSTKIDENTHNLYEEVPSLGIAADVVMATASQADEPEINVRVGLPVGALVNQNLTGYIANIGPRRQEIRQKLNGLGITPNTFPELVAGSRFHLIYLLQLSEMLKDIDTFRMENMTISSMTIHGGETMVIQTLPIMSEDIEKGWNERTVQAQSPASDSTAQVGASYIFGFQLHKGTDAETAAKEPLAQRARNWSCLSANPAAAASWVMPIPWDTNRNARRDLPPGIGTLRFRSIGKSQDLALIGVTRRMRKTQ